MTKLLIGLLTAVGVIISAVWALDSRVEAKVGKELSPIRAELVRIRENEKTLARIEERLKAIDKRIEGCRSIERR